jgi:predicted nucleotide-binding protein
VKQVKLSLGTAARGAGGYPLMLELIGGSERQSNIVPRAYVEDNRPIDDRGAPLDQDGIHALLVRSRLPSLGELRRVGHYLGGLLFYGAVGEKWADLCERFPRESPPDSEGLSIQLDIAAPELGILPWELARIGNRWAFTDPENPCARITRRFNPNPPPERDRWPLRVTVIVGADVYDPVVKVEQELENLRNALDQGGPDVEYDVIRQPPRGDFLIHELERQKPHVLHFIGHSESDRDGGVLVMNGEERRWKWTADDIVNTMPITPRIVALDACRSGDQRSQVGTWQVAEAFMRRGAYAVLAMQGDIDGGVAATFNRGLYQALLEIPAIDVAVARGRRNALAAAPRRRDFCLPTLTLARPPDRVLPRRLEREPDTAAASAAGAQAERDTRVQATAQVIEPTPGKSDSTGSRLNPTTPGSTTRIFLVHGHARAERHETVRVLERMTGLDVIVLNEQANAGRTILEKFEDSAAVTSYAVVLLTADDVGRASSASELQSRGRQNVIFELGFFFGRLGRARVTVLLGEGVEKPSDIDGLVYITLDSSGAWKQELARELRSANISVNYSRIP